MKAANVVDRTLAYVLDHIQLSDCPEDARRTVGMSADLASFFDSLLDPGLREDNQGADRIPARLWLDRSNLAEDKISAEAWAKLKEVARTAEEYVYAHLPERLYHLITLLFHEALVNSSGSRLTAGSVNCSRSESRRRLLQEYQGGRHDHLVIRGMMHGSG